MSTFARWRKAELFDLMNKLKITDVSNSTKKSDMIVLIEHYLENLSAPLDYMHDFPELQTYYEDKQQLKIESDIEDELDKISSTSEDMEYGEDIDMKEETSETSSDSSAEETETVVEKKDYNNLDFSEEPTKLQDFKFNFDQILDDIIDRAYIINENVKDYLSSISAVESIFTIIELILFSVHLFANYRTGETVLSAQHSIGYMDYYFRPEYYKREVVHFLNKIGLPILTWFFLLRIVPCFVSYYINFIRYELLVDMDPMVYHLFKGIVEFLIITRFSDNQNPIQGFLSSFSFSPLGHLHVDPCRDLREFNDALGYLPLCFSVVCTILTLYIL